MCGISCKINKEGRGVEQKDIRLMNELVKHRGPDGEGEHYYQNMALGHRRLAIIDLTAGGSQPMSWKDELVITYNGEVYNYRELRRELENKGYHFQSQSDTEVVLAAYHCWGIGCLQRFNGMWGIILLDKRTNTVFCSRDRFGVKPFYYLDGPDAFYAGSEIRQLLPFVKSRKIFAPALADYLLLNASDHTSDTFFEEIKNLRGGHHLIYSLDKKSYTISKWYTPAFHEDIHRLSEKDTVDLFKQEFERSVKWRMRSDVKVGTCLSGGLDSSYIAAVSSMQHNLENTQDKFHVFTARSIEKATDETAYAKLVVDQYHLNWKVTMPGIDDFTEAMDTVIALQEEPFACISVYMQYFVMKMARESGTKVLLDGQGADESLLGYPRYFINYINQHSFLQKPVLVKQMMAKYGMGLKTVLMYLTYFNYPFIRWQRQTSRMSGLQKQLTEACRKEYYLRYTKLSKDQGLRQVQAIDMLEMSLPLLLRYEDKNSMHFSIETRLPFLDWQLVEMVYSMNDKYRFKDGWSKYILRKSMNPIIHPEVTWRRKKLGFTAPANLWLQNSKPLENEVRKSAVINNIFDKKIPDLANPAILWKLFSLHKWAIQNDAWL
ncbi:MAG: asparagine synthase (glutamine-hydrolyzing) [Bacteroidota bacterium]